YLGHGFDRRVEGGECRPISAVDASTAPGDLLDGRTVVPHPWRTGALGEEGYWTERRGIHRLAQPLAHRGGEHGQYIVPLCRGGFPTFGGLADAEQDHHIARPRQEIVVGVQREGVTRRRNDDLSLRVEQRS